MEWALVSEIHVLHALYDLKNYLSHLEMLDFARKCVK